MLVCAAVVKVPAMLPKATLPAEPEKTSEVLVASGINVKTEALSS
jgi:hypothetical protein